MTTLPPSCPRCTGPTVERASRGGAPFWGCARGRACGGLVDIPDPRPERERIRANLAASARILARIARSWCEDSRADALQQALVPLVVRGAVAHPGVPRYLALRAVQILRGWRLLGGVVRRCSGPATPTATPGGALPYDDGDEAVGPDEWLAATASETLYPAPDALVDLSRRVAVTAEESRAEPAAPSWSPQVRAAQTLDALPLGQRRRVCADLETTIKDLGKWARGERPVPRAKVARVLEAAAREVPRP